MQVEQSQTPEQRQAAMVRLVERGFTLKKVGDKYGISRERVRQILKEADASRRRQRAPASKFGSVEPPSPGELAERLVALYGERAPDGSPIGHRTGAVHFACVSGWTSSTVYRWISGDVPIPPAVRLVLESLETNPATFARDPDIAPGARAGLATIGRHLHALGNALREGRSSAASKECKKLSSMFAALGEKL